ncbi:hypothetical protein C8T65DRAFT_136922 [Cerioporus squamosus]|nr:hypothetical protein C8T65DRAFT_136922 [Cerioporus squamosus]
MSDRPRRHKSLVRFFFLLRAHLIFPCASLRLGMSLCSTSCIHGSLLTAARPLIDLAGVSVTYSLPVYIRPPPTRIHRASC